MLEEMGPLAVSLIPAIWGSLLSSWFRLRSGKLKLWDIPWSLLSAVLMGWFAGRFIGLTILGGGPEGVSLAVFVMGLLGAQMAEILIDGDYARVIVDTLKKRFTSSDE
jgi:hypothetical protein